MSTNPIDAIKRWDWRRILFTVIAGLVTFFLLTNLFRLAAPWASMAGYPHDDPRQLNLELHRWHEAMWGAVTGILEGGVLLMLLRRSWSTDQLVNGSSSQVEVTAAEVLV